MKLMFWVWLALAACGQDLELRVSPDFGDRESLSPAVARNAWATFRVQVTGRPRVAYWMAVQSNPEEHFRYRMFRQARGSEELVEEAAAEYFFASMPDEAGARVTETYWLDVWVGPELPVDTVRLEVLVKGAAWTVAPMEVRVVETRVPTVGCCRSGGMLDALFLRAAGYGVRRPAERLTVGWLRSRNVAQDAALKVDRGELFKRAWPLLFQPQAESYPGIRQWIYRNEKNVTR